MVLVRSSIDDLDLESTAEALQRDSRFPNGTNVHVVPWKADGRCALRIGNAGSA